jgi:hypothetical protein
VYVVPVKFISALSFVFSAVFVGFARILETCFICKEGTAGNDGAGDFWQKMKTTP